MRLGMGMGRGRGRRGLAAVAAAAAAAAAVLAALVVGGTGARVALSAGHLGAAVEGGLEAATRGPDRLLSRAPRRPRPNGVKKAEKEKTLPLLAAKPFEIPVHDMDDDLAIDDVTGDYLAPPDDAD